MDFDDINILQQHPPVGLTFCLDVETKDAPNDVDEQDRLESPRDEEESPDDSPEEAQDMLETPSIPIQQAMESDVKLIPTHVELSPEPQINVEEEKSSKKGKSRRRPPIMVEWRDLTFKVKVPAGPPPPGLSPYQKFKHKMFSKTTRTILNPMSGYVAPGHILAIMGPSGAGKTSLLNILAQRVKQTAGEIYCNGAAITKSFRSLSAFVQQDDVMMGNLTVRETLRYAALLRLSSEIPIREKLTLIDDTLDELGLTNAADTIVGVPGIIKGISGGERKRLAIAIELLTEPSVLFLDEPTSGLDAKTALNVMETIRRIAQGGRTVILTIHQPRSDIFTLFDGLLLLAKGRVAYMGNAKDAKSYFEQLKLPCPDLYNPADYFIDLITEGNQAEQRKVDSERIKYILDHYQTKYEDHYQSPQIYEGLELKLGKFSRYKSSWTTQFSVLFVRSFISIMRDKMLTFARLFQTILMSLLVGLIYLRLGRDQTNVQNRIAVIFFFLLNQSMSNMFTSLIVFLNGDKRVFLRERGSKSYRVSSYYLSKSVAELPNAIFFPILNCCITYWMIGLNPGVDRFFIFIFLNVVIAITAQSMGIFLGTFAPSAEFAMAVAPLSITMLMLFGGLYLNVNSIPPWFIWIYFLSFFHYGYEALILNEFQGATFECPAPPQPCYYATGDAVIQTLGMTKPYSNIWIDVGILLFITLVLKFLSYVALRFIQKPKGG